MGLYVGAGARTAFRMRQTAAARRRRRLASTGVVVPVVALAAWQGMDGGVVGSGAHSPQDAQLSRDSGRGDGETPTPADSSADPVSRGGAGPMAISGTTLAGVNLGQPDDQAAVVPVSPGVSTPTTGPTTAPQPPAAAGSTGAVTTTTVVTVVSDSTTTTTTVITTSTTTTTTTTTSATKTNGTGRPSTLPVPPGQAKKTSTT